MTSSSLNPQPRSLGSFKKDVDDFIILRADGTPTYLLAVVVDDHDMGVTQARSSTWRYKWGHGVPFKGSFQGVFWGFEG